jgi:CBS domain-containing protein
MFDFDVLGISEMGEPRSNDVYTLGAVHLGAPVGEVPRGPALTLAPEVGIGAALEALARSPRGAAVITREQRPLGVVTTADLIRRVATIGDGREPAIATAMVACLDSLRPDDTIGAALRRMCATRTWHLPIICKEGLLIGSIDITDLTLWLRDRMTLLAMDASLGH